jgi:hypothetical protein
MGHSTITITLDRYGHLLPGNENEAAYLLDTWLRQATPPRTGFRFRRKYGGSGAALTP